MASLPESSTIKAQLDDQDEDKDKHLRSRKRKSGDIDLEEDADEAPKRKPIRWKEYGKKHIYLVACYHKCVTPEDDSIRQRNGVRSYRWEIYVEREQLAGRRRGRRYYIDTDWESVLALNGAISYDCCEWKYKKELDAPRGADMIGMIKVGTLHEAFEEEDSNGEQAKPDFIDDVAARVNIEFISPSMKMDPFSWATQVLFVLWDVGVIWTNRAVDANAAVYEGATAEIIRLGVEEWWQNWIEDRPRRGSRKVTVVEYTELQ